MEISCSNESPNSGRSERPGVVVCDSCICHPAFIQVLLSKSVGLSLIVLIVADRQDPPPPPPPRQPFLLPFRTDIKIKSSPAQQDQGPILPCLLLPRGGHQRWDWSPLRCCLLFQTLFHLGSSGRRRISDKGLVSLLAPPLPSSLSAHVFLI